MKFVLFLLGLLGAACALQYPMEYRYQYRGRVASGIPGIRAQVAALGIKATVTVQIQSKSQGFAQLSEVQVGEFNDDLQCVQLRQEVPFDWSPMPEPHKSTLQKPFAFNLQQDMKNVMQVPKDEPEFITNIRKSILEMLRLEPVVANLGGIKGDTLAKYVSGGKAPDAFSLEEESIFGRCESQYSVTRLPPHLAREEEKEIKKHIKVDEQSKDSPRSGSGSAPQLEDEYWRLVRAINFDKCHDRVVLQHTAIGNMSEASHSQFRSIQSRSSVGSYVLKGRPGSFRVERAIVEGDVIANPYGFKTHRLQTITNQTLVLESAQALHTTLPPPTPSREVKTWRFEVASPFSAPEGHPKPWVNYHDKKDKYYPVAPTTTYLGWFPSQPKIQDLQAKFVEILDAAESEVYLEPSASEPRPSEESTSGSRAATYLYLLSSMLKALPIQNVRKVFSDVYGRNDLQSQHKQIILADVAASSGASAPVKVLLEYMKNEKISKSRAASIFSTIPNNLYAPSVIPDILEFVKSINIQKEPLFASSALVNFASLVNRACMNHELFNYSLPNPEFGREMCKPKLITDDFLPYLKKKAEDASKSWERAIVIQAISNLGTPKILPILKPYIYGQQDSSPRVRIVAIYGLTKKRLPDSARQRVFEILMEIVDNVRDVPEVRQTAVAALLSWKPDTAWWQRMAKMTWREPSQSMAAFISFTIDSMSKSTEPYLFEQSRIASFAKELRKPYDMSRKYSYNHIFSRYDPNDKIGAIMEFAFLHSLRDVVPSEVYKSLRVDLGDVNFQIDEIAVSSEGISDKLIALRNLMYSKQGEYTPNSIRTPSSRYIQEMSYSDKDDKRSPQANIYIRAFENLYQYLPLNSDVISKIAGEGGSDFMKTVMRGHKVNITKFFNPVDNEYFIPTEVGLPVIGSASMPTINVGDAEVKLEAPGMSNPTLQKLLSSSNVTLLFKSNYKFISKLIVKMKVPAPWSSKQMEAGLETHSELNLPVYGNLTFSHSQEIKNLSINLSPYPDHKFPIIHAHNLPYTSVREIIPSKTWPKEYKVIAVQKNRKPALQVEKTLGNVYFGVPLESKYYADAPYPFTYANYMDYLRKPEQMSKLLVSPTAKQWQYSMQVLPSSGPHNVSLALSYMTPDSQRNRNNRIPDFSPQDTPEDRLQKLRDFSEGQQVYGLSAQVFFNVSQPRRYEAVAAYTQSEEKRHQKQYKVVVAALADRIPDYSDSPKALCSQVRLETPAIQDMDSLTSAIKSGPNEALRSELYYGSSCASSSIASIKGSFEVSRERQRLLSKEIDQICNADPMNPLVELQTPAVYDMGHLEMDFAKDQIPRQLINATYSIRNVVEGLLFPHGYHNNMHRGSQGKVTMDAKRPLSSEKFTFWTDMPDKRSIYTEIDVPYWAAQITPWTGLRTSSTKYSSLLVSSGPVGICKLSKGKAQTYDGYNYKYDPITCFTAATVSNHFSTSVEFEYLTRVTPANEMELEAIIRKLSGKNHKIVLTKSSAIIDGKPMPADKNRVIIRERGLTIAIVDRKTGYFQVILPGLLLAQVKDDIEIQATSILGGHVKGLCGDFNGDTKNELIGPDDCIFTDEELFKYAWTENLGDGCDTQKLQEELKKVHEFQKDCKKPLKPIRNESELATLYESKIGSCYQHVYPVKRIDHNSIICLSKSPVQICKQECVKHEQESKSVLSKCWPYDSAPQAVKKGEQVGYLRYPLVESGKFERSVKVESATNCKPS